MQIVQKVSINLLEIPMDEDVKKKVLIVVSVVIICIALAIAGKTMFGGGGGGGDGKIWFKCVNPKCNAAYSLSPDEFTKLQGDSPMMIPGQMQAFKCQKCGQQSAYMAQKCENKKCGEVFILQMGSPGQANQDFPDRCPKCKYSVIEQMEKEQK
jgi:hypothetical protein